MLKEASQNKNKPQYRPFHPFPSLLADELNQMESVKLVSPCMSFLPCLNSLRKDSAQAEEEDEDYLPDLQEVSASEDEDDHDGREAVAESATQTSLLENTSKGTTGTSPLHDNQFLRSSCISQFTALPTCSLDA